MCSRVYVCVLSMYVCVLGTRRRNEPGSHVKRAQRTNVNVDDPEECIYPNLTVLCALELVPI